MGAAAATEISKHETEEIATNLKTKTNKKDVGLLQVHPHSHGFRWASEGREPLKDNRRPLRRSRPRLGLHHSTVLTDSLHPRSRSSLSYNPHCTAMAFIPAETPKMAKGTRC